MVHELGKSPEWPLTRKRQLRDCQPARTSELHGDSIDCRVR